MQSQYERVLRRTGELALIALVVLVLGGLEWLQAQHEAGATITVAVVVVVAAIGAYYNASDLWEHYRGAN
ncbi:hypothetical protein [Natronobacterium gregoryi]|uniref:Uncharacterized protein n=2 Tax=Natronobacterium gregoryi TaxID=44930 RepID=L0AL39_NATGS|nr:hypothetical protein [Natronobacterium gregoryi]AFZ74593.1 hypothetical protein Natgr_3474 [Natronobacterium gregoryi SP2]ELY72583.1 hypothetical protein C490_03303 [Natronobacterium gregoryi SP2]PLK19783.1 hypothetical protein CYV19_12810 [Natronobacterium gregoryi SP2]SFJ30101.1 hypothetical protein SAMN05443661_12111 [Natronobacterium gregoryi]